MAYIGLTGSFMSVSVYWTVFCWTLPTLVRNGPELLDRRVPAPRLIDIIVTNFVCEGCT